MTNAQQDSFRDGRAEEERVQGGDLKDVRLDTVFPISFGYVVKQTLPWALLGGIFIALAIFLFSAANPYREFKTDYGAFKFWVMFLLGSAIFIGKFVYAYFYAKSMRFGLQNGMFVLRKGIIIHWKGNYPLTSITNTYIHRNLLDWICGTCTFILSTANEMSDDFARISGLSYQDGKRMHSLFAPLLNKYQVSRKDILDLQRAVVDIGE